MKHTQPQNELLKRNWGPVQSERTTSSLNRICENGGGDHCESHQSHWGCLGLCSQSGPRAASTGFARMEVAITVSHTQAMRGAWACAVKANYKQPCTELLW
eukprot:1150018-Pelagomonas_calceolata.AAC.2